MDDLYQPPYLRSRFNKSVQDSWTGQLTVLEGVLTVVWRSHFRFKVEEIIVSVVTVHSEYTSVVLKPMKRVLLSLFTSFSPIVDHPQDHGFQITTENVSLNVAGAVRVPSVFPKVPSILNLHTQILFVVFKADNYKRSHWISLSIDKVLIHLTISLLM